MVARRKSEQDVPQSTRPPATTPEARENQVISLAIDLAEQQIRDGTASAQVITHFLKLGSSREELEKEKLRADNLLAMAKIEQISSASNTEQLYKEALSAMRSYQGQEVDEDLDDENY